MMIKSKKLKVKSQRSGNGFSLMEVIVVIAIVGVITTFAGVSFSAFRNAKLLDSTAQDILSLINTARVKSISSENASRYGVHFEADRAVLFAGNSFVEPSASNMELNLSPSVEISEVSLFGEGADVVFERITGETGNYGSVTVRISSDASKTKIIEIRSAGSVEIK
ncbi:MAG: hypothetical protein COV02_02820 [Candidatus Terrybacteria bacterium CG10_big_fil_rev_8_21_14_0_10_41_10]|uniref:General secretion pathway GspH domain-containing protein n=1 Tax=Candidatus Terrybacteria bacterium CG10_big_fil_rev_8_21_14_0_10_41_10 TaxID=1975026 RepID=A0A2M8L9W8_9BACT|nr:MAG: hypothetical protein COV02_02820 [Candidatus Terrybacteria bacterium CG10_big_fil_rev_8_21_14_0_10_41_10]